MWKWRRHGDVNTWQERDVQYSAGCVVYLDEVIHLGIDACVLSCEMRNRQTTKMRFVIILFDKRVYPSVTEQN